MLKVEVLGGVGEYGRNCFYIEKDGRGILLDCGIMNNGEKTLPDLRSSHAAKLDAVFISHSHTDHTGALYLLQKWYCHAPIVMSDMTASQLKGDFQNEMTFENDSSGKWITINERLRFKWGYTGHLIGSVWYKIDFCGEHIFYSGDYVADSYLMKSTLPALDGNSYDVAIIDSGHIEKRINNKEVLNRLRTYVDTVAPGPVVVPSSYSGKTADLAVYLFQHAKAKITVSPSLHTFFKDYFEAPHYLRNGICKDVMKQFSKVCLGNEQRGDARVVHFIADDEEETIRKMLDDASSSIVQTGYSRVNGQGQLQAEGRVKEFFYKTHPDYDDLLKLTAQIDAKRIILFHSPYTNIKANPLKFLKEKV